MYLSYSCTFVSHKSAAKDEENIIICFTLTGLSLNFSYLAKQPTVHPFLCKCLSELTAKNHCLLRPAPFLTNYIARSIFCSRLIYFTERESKVINYALPLLAQTA